MLPSQQQKKTSGLSFLSTHSLLQRTRRRRRGVRKHTHLPPLFPPRTPQKDMEAISVFKCEWVHIICMHSLQKTWCFLKSKHTLTHTHTHTYTHISLLLHHEMWKKNIYKITPTHANTLACKQTHMSTNNHTHTLSFSFTLTQSSDKKPKEVAAALDLLCPLQGGEAAPSEQRYPNGAGCSIYSNFIAQESKENTSRTGSNQHLMPGWCSRERGRNYNNAVY